MTELRLFGLNSCLGLGHYRSCGYYVVWLYCNAAKWRHRPAVAETVAYKKAAEKVHSYRTEDGTGTLFAHANGLSLAHSPFASSLCIILAATSATFLALSIRKQ